MTYSFYLSLKSLRRLIWVLNVLVLGAAVYLYPVNWDEGWTFCSARHLLEDAHYGCMYNGHFTPTRLTTSTATVLMTYLGFVLFGVSYVSGRLMFAIQTLLLIYVYSAIVRRAWGERVEVICLICLLILSSDPRVHPLFLGAQAWGEVPALLSFCIGMLMLQPWFFEGMGVRTPARVVLSVSFLILSANIKVQFRPFVAAACVSAGLFLILTRHTRRMAAIFLIAGVSVWLLATRIPALSMPLQQPLDMTGMVSTGNDIIYRLALVLDPEVRMRTLEWICTTHGLLLLLFPLALFVKRADGRSVWREESRGLLPVVTFSIIVFSWFITLAIDFPRYVAPSLILAAGPVALVIEMLCSGSNVVLPGGLRLPVVIYPKYRRWVMAACLFVGLTNTIAVGRMMFAYRSYNQDLLRTAAFINTTVKPGDIVETYDSALYHLLNIPYIFPPDDYHLLLPQARAAARQKWKMESARYLILGDWSRMFEIVAALPNPPDGFIERARFGEFWVLERIK